MKVTEDMTKNATQKAELHANYEVKCLLRKLARMWSEGYEHHVDRDLMTSPVQESPALYIPRIDWILDGVLHEPIVQLGT